MNSGVVPQQPPTMFNQPFSAHSRTVFVNSTGLESNPPIPSGIPALG